jgi:hypothetical protein
MFRSSIDVDDFVAALPVLQIYDTYVGVFRCESTFINEFLMMMCWLQTSMEISEVSLCWFTFRVYTTLIICDLLCRSSAVT